MKPIYIDLSHEDGYGGVEKDSLGLTLLDDGKVLIEVGLGYFPGTVTAVVSGTELLRLLELTQQAEGDHQVPFLEEPAPVTEGLEFDPTKPRAFRFHWWHRVEDPPIYLRVPIATEPCDMWAPGGVMIEKSKLVAAIKEIKAAIEGGRSTKTATTPVEAYASLRRGLRQLLAEHGVASNPCWTDEQIVEALRELLGR